ncbi:MAG: DUF1972 domain-containing protein [Alistipes sp.]|nr:DUF1972 domain-containing protein [Alistipes sp.]
MIQTTVIVVVTILAILFICRYIFRELTDPCRGCASKECKGCTRPKRVAVVGTQGIPAQYGGFESLAEYLVESNSNIEYTVFCSSKDMPSRPTHHKGARLIYIPLKANGIQSIPYDIISLIRAMGGYDTVLVLGVSGAIFLPIFRLFSRAKVVTNIDGLEHRRQKWGKLARWFLRLSEKVAVKFSHTIISDNKGIADYVVQTYNKESELIAYGGDHVLQSITLDKQMQILEKYNLTPYTYSFALCRIEPENNCHIILEAAANSGIKLLFIGNWDRSEYGRDLKSRYAKFSNITLHDPVYELDDLFVLRNNASRYLHGHSAGGTNPSLVEAMFFGREIIAYDVVYNRETTSGKAIYFSDSESLSKILTRPSVENKTLAELAHKLYTWDTIRNKYEQLL